MKDKLIISINVSIQDLLHRLETLDDIQQEGTVAKDTLKQLMENASALWELWCVYEAQNTALQQQRRRGKHD